MTVDKANTKFANIVHTNKAYDPKNKSLTFYTTDPTKRCYSLENFESKNSAEDFDKAAEDLRLATRHLGIIVGKVDVEEILGSIFNDFCIGK